MKKDKGQAIAQVLMWGGGILATASFAFAGFVNNKVSSAEKIITDNNTALVQRTSTLEAESRQYKDDIKDIKDLIKDQTRLIQELNKKLQ